MFLETWYSQDNTLSSHSISALSGDGRTLSPSPSLSMQSAPSTQTVSASITYHTCSPSPSSSQPPSTCTQVPSPESASAVYNIYPIFQSLSLLPPSTTGLFYIDTTGCLSFCCLPHSVSLSFPPSLKNNFQGDSFCSSSISCANSAR